MFYQVQYLPRGSEIWVHHRKTHLTLKEVLDEVIDFRVGCPFWRYRIIKCEVLDD